MAVFIFWVMALGWGGAESSGTKALNEQGWKQLRGRAKSAEEFRMLAQYCLRQAETKEQKAAECERELERVRKDPSGLGRLPKWPPREATLKDLAGVYRGEAKQWRERAAEYQQRQMGAN